MVPVAGRPLIELAVERFRAGGINQLTVIINETSDDCREWLLNHAEDFDLEVIVRTTPSSYASFREVASRLAGTPAVVTTVDAVMPINNFNAFVRSANDLARDAICLALTDHTYDEHPLWATLYDGRIRELGGETGTHVTAGLYWLPARRPREPAIPFARLRDYLGWLVTRDEPVYGIVLPRVFDIDRARDIAAAESAGIRFWA
jgi:NDP-sugar pyrophosphorylase family protein